MRNKIALLLVLSILFSIICATNTPVVNAADEYEYTDRYGNDELLTRYSTAEIVEMYPEFSEYLASEIRALNEDISVRGFDIDKENIGAIYFSVVCENPDIFYVFPTRFETTANTETQMVVSVRPEFFFDISEIPSRIDEFNKNADYILSGVNRSWNDVTKARYIHDMLAQYTEYDTKYETISDKDYELFKVQMRIYTSYGALVDNNAVCEGYSMAYKYLLSKVGVKAYYVQSVEKRHAWNMVEINGKVYHVDVTHDDPTYDNLGRVNHNKFLKSDNYFNSDGDDEHIHWITNLKADDTSYDDAWWNSINTLIFRYDDYDYYVNQVYGNSIYAALTRRNTGTGTTEVLNVCKNRWTVKDDPNAFWERAYSYLTSDGTYLYYNDADSVYRMAIGSETSQKVYTKSGTTNDIYGVAFKLDGRLYATIKETPVSQDVIYKLDITAEEPTEPSSSESEPTDSSQPSQPTSTEPTSTEPTTEPITAEPTTQAPVTAVTVKRSVSLYLKRSLTLTLTPKGAYSFSSSKKTVATVTSKGLITAKKAGKAVITAKGKSVIFKITITVKNPKLNVTKKTLKKGKSFTLKVVGGSGKITYKTSNKKIASINTNGKVKARKKGKATITVKVCGLTLKCKVTVK